MRMKRRIFKSRWAWACTFTWEDGYSRTLYAGSFDAAVRLAGTSPERRGGYPRLIPASALPSLPPKYLEFCGVQVPSSVFGPPPGQEWETLDVLAKKYIN